MAGHESRLGPSDITTVAGVTVTTPARTLLDHASALPLEDLIALGDAILHTRLATGEELAALAVPGRRGIRNLRAAVPLLDGRAESVPESRLRVRIHFSDLPDAEPQTKVYDAAGRLVARLDLGYDEWKVGIEYEGRHHADDEQFDYDIDRYTEVESLGWHLLRPGRRDLPNGSATFLERLARRLPASRQQ